MGWIWGAATPQDAVNRFSYLETYGGPDAEPSDQHNFNLFELIKSILGIAPTANEYSGVYAADQQGQSISYITAVKAQHDAAKAAAAAAAVITPAVDKVNDLAAKTAIVQAETAFTLAQQANSDASMPLSASNPSLFSSLGGGAIGFTTPDPAASGSSKTPVIVLGIAGVLLYLFWGKIFGR